MPAKTGDDAAAQSLAGTHELVGYKFMEQYYTILHREPARLHMFYKKDSMSTHTDIKGSAPVMCTGQLVRHPDACSFYLC